MIRNITQPINQMFMHDEHRYIRDHAMTSPSPYRPLHQPIYRYLKDASNAVSPNPDVILQGIIDTINAIIEELE
jgi:hypothetical protein